MTLLHSLKKFFYLHILKRKYFRTGKCNCCGKCCEKIYVKHGKTIIQDEERFEKLKFLHSFYSDLSVVGKDETGLVFSCNNLDNEIRKCKIHNNRAKICRDYPQEEIFMMGGEMGENCGYKFTPIIPFEDILKKVSKKSCKNPAIKFFSE